MTKKVVITFDDVKDVGEVILALQLAMDLYADAMTEEALTEEERRTEEESLRHLERIALRIYDDCPVEQEPEWVIKLRQARQS